MKPQSAHDHVHELDDSHPRQGARARPAHGALMPLPWPRVVLGQAGARDVAVHFRPRQRLLEDLAHRDQLREIDAGAQSIASSMNTRSSVTMLPEAPGA